MALRPSRCTRPPGDDPQATPLVDVAVRMRRFPDGALWSERIVAGQLAAPEVAAMAQRLARLHEAAPVAPPESPYGTAEAQARIVAGLVAAMDSWHATAAPTPEAAAWPPLRQWRLETHARLTPSASARLDPVLVPDFTPQGTPPQRSGTSVARGCHVNLSGGGSGRRGAG